MISSIGFSDCTPTILQVDLSQFFIFAFQTLQGMVKTPDYVKGSQEWNDKFRNILKELLATFTEKKLVASITLPNTWEEFQDRYMVSILSKEPAVVRANLHFNPKNIIDIYCNVVFNVVLVCIFYLNAILKIFLVVV